MERAWPSAPSPSAVRTLRYRSSPTPAMSRPLFNFALPQARQRGALSVGPRRGQQDRRGISARAASPAWPPERPHSYGPAAHRASLWPPLRHRRAVRVGSPGAAGSEFPDGHRGHQPGQQWKEGEGGSKGCLLKQIGAPFSEQQDERRRPTDWRPSFSMGAEPSKGGPEVSNASERGPVRTKNIALPDRTAPHMIRSIPRELVLEREQGAA